MPASPKICHRSFSYYDHVLDTARTVGATPARFDALGLDALDTLFAMAAVTAACGRWS